MKNLKEYEKLFIEWFIGGFHVNEETAKIDVKDYMTPSKSSMVYTDKTNQVIFPSFNLTKLNDLGSSEPVYMLVTKFIVYQNSLMRFNKSNFVFDMIKPSAFRTEAFMNLSKNYDIFSIRAESDKRWKVSFCNSKNPDDFKDIVFYIDTKTFKHKVLTKLKELDRIVERVELYKKHSHGKKFFSEIAYKKGFYFYDMFSSKNIEKFIFDEDSLNKIKKMKLNKLTSMSSPFKFQEEIAKVLDITINKDNKKTTIDNGWGSYTYTFMCYSINYTSLCNQDKKLVSYFWNRFKNIASDPDGRYLRLNGGQLGFVQSSGGYTHVS